MWSDFDYMLDACGITIHIFVKVINK